MEPCYEVECGFEFAAVVRAEVSYSSEVKCCVCGAFENERNIYSLHICTPSTFSIYLVVLYSLFYTSSTLRILRTLHIYSSE